MDIGQILIGVVWLSGMLTLVALELKYLQLNTVPADARFVFSGLPAGTILSQ